MANSRKKTRKTGEAVKNKAETMAEETVRRSFKGWLAGIAAVLIAGGVAFTFVPEESVPAALEPLHTELLAARNTVIAKTGLEISRFDDTAVVEVPGASPVKLYFAPSPNIKRGLCDFIRSAKSTVDICIYDLDLNEVADALLDAKGVLHLERAGLAAYVHGRYRALGRELGKFGFSVQKKQEAKR